MVSPYAVQLARSEEISCAVDSPEVIKSIVTNGQHTSSLGVKGFGHGVVSA